MSYSVISKESFDIHYVNPNAKVVIVGISPGSSQSSNTNYNPKKDSKYNNQQCAFKDPKRKAIQNNLIKMLDSISINKYLDINSCSSLWNEDFDKINFISVLPHSVLKNDKFISKIEYSEIVKNSLLKREFDLFIDALTQYSKDTIFVACGPSVYEILVNHTSLDSKKIVPIAHPSGANSGRVNAYCSKKIKDNRKEDKSYQKALALRKTADEVLMRLFK